MSTYQQCPPSVSEMASRVLCQFKTHEPVLDAKVTIEYLFAYGAEDANGIKSPAINHNGVQALGLCRIVSLKDRVKGCKDIEITLDGDWWGCHDEAEQEALLDHELHHIEVVPGKKDDHGRPKIRLRKHDIEVGWFSTIAARHGKHSKERIQARSLMEHSRQFYWPDLHGFDERGVALDASRAALDGLRASAKRLFNGGAEIRIAEAH
jgi:hypothetical protein